MRVEVLLFASARSWAGRERLELEAAEGATVRSLLDAPELAGLRPHLASTRFAVNEEFAPLERPLRDGDVVAVLPPVSGG